jgi:hypothetical protein
LNIAVGDMAERETFSSLFCKSLAQLEKFFYKGLVHKGVKLPAAINFANYTHGTGQVRSNFSVSLLF